jgi:plasmid stabilization system protein ParE
MNRLMTSLRKAFGALLKLVIRAGARQDILDIIQYGTSEYGAAAARAYVGKLRARLEWLRCNPKLGSLYHDFDGSVRSFRQGQHRIYYSADDHIMVVIRILHMSSDIERHFELSRFRPR